MEQNETIAVVDTAINMLEDLKGRGLVDTTWANKGIDELRQHLVSARDEVVAALVATPESAALLKALCDDPDYLPKLAAREADLRAREAAADQREAE